MSGMIQSTVSRVLAGIAERYPNDLAVKYNDRDYEKTWAEFNNQATQIAKGLLSLGLRKGDHIAIWATNVPEWLLTLFASAKIGAVLVTVNTSYKIFELEYLLRQSDAKMLVLTDGFRDSNYVEITQELCRGLDKAPTGEYYNPMLPCLKTVIHVGENTPAGMVPFCSLEARAADISDAEIAAIEDGLDCHDVINIQYTSGTTGFPKGVMLTHYNILNNGRLIGDCMKFTHADKLCIPVPFFHCFGLVLAIMACLTHDSAMVPVEVYRPLDVMKAVMEEECTALHGVPTMFIGILDHPQFKEFRFPKLRTGIMAGSPCPVKVMQQVVDEMGASEITIAYGQTECSPVATQTTTDDSIELRVSTVGRVHPGVEGKIIDPETGKMLGPNAPGEFCTRGYHVMKGYYKMEEATAQAIDKDGWLHTGDVATVDENGYYKITGRIKDMIIRGGENIYPKEIEEFLYTHPSISDVQVVGAPSKRYGEEIAAYIIPREGMSLTEDEVKDYVRSHMARHKVPRYVVFTDRFPMTASGKIQKYILREMVIERFHLEDEAAIETA